LTARIWSQAVEGKVGPSEVAHEAAQKSNKPTISY